MQNSWKSDRNKFRINHSNDCKSPNWRTFPYLSLGGLYVGYEIALTISILNKIKFWIPELTKYMDPITELIKEEMLALSFHFAEMFLILAVNEFSLYNTSSRFNNQVNNPNPFY